MLTMTATQLKNGQTGNYSDSKSLEELETGPPCIFPTLVDASTTEQRDFLSFETDISKTEELMELSTRYNVSVASLIQATWAIVLGGYAGTTEVCFGFQNPESTSDGALVRAQLDLNQSLLETVRYMNSLENNIFPLNQKQRRRLLRPDGIGICNTELRYIPSRLKEGINEFDLINNSLVCHDLRISTFDNHTNNTNTSTSWLT